MSLQKEYITSKVFKMRLGIGSSTFKKAMKDRHIYYDKTKPVGNSYMIEWYSNRKSFLENASNPLRYTPEEIQKRLQNRLKKDYQIVERVERSQSDGGKSADELLEIEEPEDVDNEFKQRMNKREAEAVKQLYLAKQAKFKYLKDAGVVVESARVIREWKEIAIHVKKLMLAIPNRVSELFASMTDAKEIKELLTIEIVHALSRLHYEYKVEVGKIGSEGDEIGDTTEEEDSDIDDADTEEE